MDNKVTQIVRDVFGVETKIVLTRPDAQFGDYTTNAALQLAKQVGKSPREIAEQIADKLRESGDYEAVEVAGPGFINLTLSSEALLELTNKEPVPAYAGKTLVFEYSCPNAFKELHTGHLY